MIHTLIVFVYNQRRYIDQLSENLKLIIDEFDEILIVDDFSNDGTNIALIESGVLSFPNVKLYVNNENLGINRNFSYHVLRCEADVITLIGGDDFIAPGYGRKIRNRIQKMKFVNEHKFMFISNVRLYGGGEKVIRNYESPARITKEYLLNILTGTLHPYETPTSKELSYSVGPWNDQFGLQADVARQLEKLYTADHVEFIDDIGVIYVPNVGVTSRTSGAKNLSDFIRVCHATIKFTTASEKAMVTPLIEYLELLHSLLTEGKKAGLKKKLKAFSLIRRRFLLRRIHFNNPLFSLRLCFIVCFKAIFT